MLLVWVRVIAWDWFYLNSLISSIEPEIYYEINAEVCLEPDVRRSDVRYVLCVNEFYEVTDLWKGRVLWKSNFDSHFDGISKFSKL